MFNSSFSVDVKFADGFPVASYLPSASKNVNSHKIYIFLILLQKIPPLGTFTQNICLLFSWFLTCIHRYKSSFLQYKNSRRDYRELVAVY